MSMYASAYVETGLLLTEDEFERFKKRYLETHAEVDPDDFDDWCYCGEELDPSDPTDEIKSFNVTPLLDDNCEGTYLYSWGEKNPGEEFASGVYVIPLNKTEFNPFKEFPYKDLNEVIDEIKHKVGGYLPKNFKYKERIGMITCSYYA